MAVMRRYERWLVAMAVTAARRPVWTLMATLLTVTAALGAACWQLKYFPQRDALLSADNPCQKRWLQYIQRFGADEDAVIVITGANPARQKEAADAVAARLTARPELFDRVFYRVDLRPLQYRALLYLSVPELEQLWESIRHLEPLLGEQGRWGWRMLSIQTLLSRAAAALVSDSPSKMDALLLAQLPALLRAGSARLHAESGPPPWQWTPHQQHQQESWSEALQQPQYLQTPDGTTTVLLCRLVGADASPQESRQAVVTLRALLDEVQADYPDLTLGLTGLPVLESDEMTQADQDARRATLIALLGVIALYAWVYRGLRYPLLTVLTLVIGTIWALGWATWTVGHLNILSAAFAVMMIGVGDYGVLWVARYDEGRQQGLAPLAAIEYAGRMAGPSIVTAALTTGTAFGALLAVNFQAVAELGWIAGCGVLFCALSCCTVLPALLVISERWSQRTTSRDVRQEQPAQLTIPRLVLPLAAILLVLAGVGIGKIHYDHNLLHLQARNLESVYWQQHLNTHAAGMTWDALSIAESREEAADLAQRYRAIPEVNQVVEVASLLPGEQERKLPLLQEIHQRLQRLPEVPPLPAVAVEAERVVRLAEQVAALAAGRTELQEAARRFAQRVREAPEASQRLRDLDRWLSAELFTGLRQLREMSHPVAVTQADIPVALRERYVSQDGAFLVRAFAREDLWEYAALERFIQAVATVDPQATGKTFRTYEGLRQMQRGFAWTCVYALAVVAFILWLDLRRGWAWLAALLPLTAGLLLTAGTMGWCGLDWNPANLVALPLLLGIGLDNGVHVLHDYLHRHDKSQPWQLGRSVARGIIVAGLTTLIGFAALALARHRGMASLGIVMSLGVAWCLLTAVVLLPALLQESQKFPHGRRLGLLRTFAVFRRLFQRALSLPVQAGGSRTAS
ncbi:MAG: MMPL family transporter [Gemmataceae bacterium]|nr:MMPL family transporter [Gemmataceae bacterium]